VTELVQKRAVIIFAEYSPAGCNNPRGRIQFTTEKMFSMARQSVLDRVKPPFSNQAYSFAFSRTAI